MDLNQFGHTPLLSVDLEHFGMVDPFQIQGVLQKLISPLALISYNKVL
jgi:hypothetical protein